MNRQPLQLGRINLPSYRAGDRRQLALPDPRDHQNRGRPEVQRHTGDGMGQRGLECEFVFNEAHEYVLREGLA